jgi:hypothetical protein
MSATDRGKAWWLAKILATKRLSKVSALASRHSAPLMQSILIALSVEMLPPPAQHYCTLPHVFLRRDLGRVAIFIPDITQNRSSWWYVSRHKTPTPPTPSPRAEMYSKESTVRRLLTAMEKDHEGPRYKTTALEDSAVSFASLVRPHNLTEQHRTPRPGRPGPVVCQFVMQPFFGHKF